MSLTPNPALSDQQVVARLRKIADMINDVDVLIQSTFEADDELYELCTQLQDLCGDFEAEADELASMEDNG
jgi:phosphoglycerate-specific signal transduction histidine kinase